MIGAPSLAVGAVGVVDGQMGTAAALGLVALAVAALLALVLAVRLHALLALLAVSLLVAVVGGLPLGEVASEVQRAMGGTLGYIAIVIGLGAIFGEILDRSGAARRIATGLLARSGKTGARRAFALTGLVVAIPVFFDVAFILLLPLVRSAARRAGRSIPAFAFPLLAGLAVAHAFVPPTPGPVAVAGLVGAELGWVILFGLAAGLPALWVAGLVFGDRAARDLAEAAPVATAVDPEESEEVRTAGDGPDDREHGPGFGVALGLILLPLGLIVLSTAAPVLLDEGSLHATLRFFGHPFTALLLTVLLASWVLGRRHGWSAAELRRMADRSLEPVGLILLVTGAGGVLGKVLLATGAGSTLAGALEDSGLPLFVLAFLLALVVRLAQGSATVSMVTAAGLVAPVAEAASLGAPSLGLLTVSIAAGATACSHVNDSGFWLVSRYLGLDEGQTLRSWTPMTALIGITGLAVVLLLSPLAAAVPAHEVPAGAADGREPVTLEATTPEPFETVPGGLRAPGREPSAGSGWIPQNGISSFPKVPADPGADRAFAKDGSGLSATRSDRPARPLRYTRGSELSGA